MFAISPD